MILMKKLQVIVLAIIFNIYILCFNTSLYLQIKSFTGKNFSDTLSEF